MIESGLQAPRIARLSWGRIEVEGYPPFRDAKVFPGGAREWDWRKTGTRHRPGIQPADVQELIDRGARVVVLSRGIWNRLGVCTETLEVLAKNGIAVEVLQSEAAVERFNTLGESMPVGGLSIQPANCLGNGARPALPDAGRCLSRAARRAARLTCGKMPCGYRWNRAGCSLVWLA